MSLTEINYLTTSGLYMFVLLILRYFNLCDETEALSLTQRINTRNDTPICSNIEYKAASLSWEFY